MRNTQDEVDLGLSLGLANNYRAAAAAADDEIGAGVNANSFAAPSDPAAVAELVWSPHHGLRLKCTGPSPTTRGANPLILWNVGPSGREEDGANPNLSPAMLDSDQVLVGGNSRKDDEAGTLNPVLGDAHDKSEAVAESNPIADGEMDTDAKFSCKKPASKKVFGGYGKAKINFCKSDVMGGLNVENLRFRASKISEDLAYSLPNIKNREEEEEEEVTSSNKNKEIIPESPIDAIPLDNIGCSAENDFVAKDKDAMADGIFLNRQQKGKEKVVPERDEEEDSNESVESCNNAGFFSKGAKKRGNCCHEGTSSYSESKRAKNEAVQGSFANWMSNMVKGLSCGDGEDHRPFPLGLSLARSNDFGSKRRHDYGGGNNTGIKGFKKVFRSLYCHTKTLDRREGFFVEGPEEEANAVEPKLLIENLPNNSCTKIIVPNEDGKETSGNISDKAGEGFSCEPSLAREGDSGENEVLNRALGPDSLCKPCNNRAEASNLNNASLWITRFCSRNVALHGQHEDKEEISREDKSTNFADPKTSRVISPLVCFQKSRSPEEMASTFMWRLDALRQGSLHPKEPCDVREEENHHHHEPSHEAHGNGKAPLLSSFGAYLTWNVKEKSENNNITLESNGARKGSDLNPGIFQKDVDVKEQPRSESLATPEMFLAISKLWLSRSDILRWMHSNSSTKYLNGFFLRLRLGKSEEGIGETGYYVACITVGGDARKHGNGLISSKKSILVDVGGIKTCIESQYISNHNFLEDEIKAWWCKTVKSGGKIPSLHDLNSKFEDRKYLGF